MGKETILLVVGLGGRTNARLAAPLSARPRSLSSFGSRHFTPFIWCTKRRAEKYAFVEDGRRLRTVRHHVANNLQQEADRGHEKEVS